MQEGSRRDCQNGLDGQNAEETAHCQKPEGAILGSSNSFPPVRISIAEMILFRGCPVTDGAEDCFDFFSGHGPVCGFQTVPAGFRIGQPD